MKFGVTDSICDLSTMCLNTQTSGFQVQHIFNDVDKERWCYYEGDSVIVTLYELDDVTIASFSDKYCIIVTKQTVHYLSSMPVYCIIRGNKLITRFLNTIRTRNAR